MIHNNAEGTDRTEGNNNESITDHIHGTAAKAIDSVTNKNPRRIDTHHHISPEFYAKAVEETGGDPSGWPAPTWSVEQTKEQMSLLGIETAIVSITAPGTRIYEDNKEKGRILARKLNEFSADLVKNNPKQFGFFASLPPLTDIEGALAEIDYVQSELKADGFTLFTSYGHGQYLGHPSFQPIWAKLNEIKTVVFIHPSEAPTTIVNHYLPQPIVEYPQETTRTASDLVLTGTRAKFPDVKIILSHAGGTLPFLADRIITMATNMPSLHCPRDARQILDDFRSFYYDTTMSSSSLQLHALLEFADPSKILFGSDVPLAPFPAVLDCTKNLDDFFLKNKSDQHENLWQAINRENAKVLFPDKVKD
jgi:predicted TIM-barrel fold metal-dependent hydrolase